MDKNTFVTKAIFVERMLFKTTEKGEKAVFFV